MSLSKVQEKIIGLMQEGASLELTGLKRQPARMRLPDGRTSGVNVSTVAALSRHGYVAVARSKPPQRCILTPEGWTYEPAQARERDAARRVARGHGNGAAAALGRRGGSVRSQAKAKAARRNGRKGGKPRGK